MLNLSTILHRAPFHLPPNFKSFFKYIVNTPLGPVSTGHTAWVCGHPLQHEQPTNGHVLKGEWLSLPQHSPAANNSYDRGRPWSLSSITLFHSQWNIPREDGIFLVCLRKKSESLQWRACAHVDIQLSSGDINGFEHRSGSLVCGNPEGTKAEQMLSSYPSTLLRS